VPAAAQALPPLAFPFALPFPLPGFGAVGPIAFPVAAAPVPAAPAPAAPAPVDSPNPGNDAIPTPTDGSDSDDDSDDDSDTADTLAPEVSTLGAVERRVPVNAKGGQLVGETLVF
jgi:hypothetical protein